MTKAEFIDWKSHAVTQEIFNIIKSHITEGRDELEAGPDPQYAAKVIGKLAAYRAVLDISFEDNE